MQLMKIIQVTDTHLMPRGTELNGLNPNERLESCIASITEHHSDAEFCIITGDLTDRGDPDAPITIFLILLKTFLFRIIL